MKSLLFCCISTCVILLLQCTLLNAQQLSLSPSNYNGYNVSCFGGNNGSINLTISGGVSPYSILWSTNATTEDISNLPAGYYRVTVDDADTSTRPVEAEITLTEPRKIGISSIPYQFPNQFNISVFGACNGSIDITVTDGVPPYTYSWTDGPTTQDRTSLCAATYKVRVIDQNNCELRSESILLKEPERGDWQLTGNQGINPSTQFIGTTDNVGLNFKTNNQNRLNITNNGIFEFNGQLKIDTPSTDLFRSLFVDQNGILRIYGPGGGGSPYVPSPDWNTLGNANINDQVQFIGTLNPADLVFKTTNSFGTFERMRINQSGNLLIANSVGIGTSSIPASGYKLIVEGNIGAREIIIVKPGDPWPDYVFDKNYKKLSFNELKQYIEVNKHLPGLPTSSEVEEAGSFSLGKIQIEHLEKTEELFLYLIELQNEIESLKSQISKLTKN